MAQTDQNQLPKQVPLSLEEPSNDRLSACAGKTPSKMIYLLALALPFVLGASLHLSLVFSTIAALPIAFISLTRGRWFGIAAALSNTALVMALSSRETGAIFLVSGVVVGLSIAECLRAKRSPEVTAAITVGLILVAVFGLLVGYSWQIGQNPIKKLDAYVGELVRETVNQVEQNAKRYGQQKISNQDLEKLLIDPETTRKNIMAELPSTFLIGTLILVVSNLLLILRLNFGQIRQHLQLPRRAFRNWHAPEHMVWPTLLAAALMILEVPKLGVIGLNALKVLMSIYALQGLAIVTFFFDRWRIKGPIRAFGYVMSVLVLLPLLLSLGFFDLWIGFRKKFVIQE